jgi:hypothetical protein
MSSELPEIVVETYDNGQTHRYMGTKLGEWLETDTVVNVGDYQ